VGGSGGDDENVDGECSNGWCGCGAGVSVDLWDSVEEVDGDVSGVLNGGVGNDFEDDGEGDIGECDDVPRRRLS
jgi:hypothetical protein